MAGTKRGKKGGAKRAPAKPRAPARPVLGNDPFTRGAAARMEAATGSATRALEGPPTPTPGALEAPRSPGALEAPRTPGASEEPLTPGASEEPLTPGASEEPLTPSVAPAEPARSRGARSRGPSPHARLAAVEEKVERALAGAEERIAAAAARAGIAQTGAEAREAATRLLPALKEKLGALKDLALVFEPPGRLDRHGMDPRLVERSAPLVELLYASWWRTAVRGIERIPATGGAIVVANHAGLVPWDALVLRHALRRDHPAHRELRPLVDDREADATVVGPLAIRLGAVRASPESAERLLHDGLVVGVFPEGSAGARKPWRDRYRIQHFGRGGFVKLALRTGAPIVPCAIVGSEETSPGISRTGWLAEQLGIPLLSASPLFTLGAAAILPLPARWTLRFGDPVDLDGAGPSAAEDAAVVRALTERVRATVQAMLDEDVAARGSVFL